METYIIRMRQSPQKTHVPVGVVEEVFDNEKREFNNSEELKEILDHYRENIKNSKCGKKTVDTKSGI